ncbi:MAG TPA: hypothetical protein VL096_08125 [Pirellulaceae bacterium]|nr:hypothetical protein [Pirellulaceae bacterium]
MKIRWKLWMMLIAMALGATGCSAVPKAHNLPPAQQLMEPGPGVGGPGPGVLAPPPPPMMFPMPMPTVQVLFNKPENMQVRWDVGGYGQFDSEPLVTPARYNFPQGAIYRLKLTNIEGRDAVELYPTVEIGPTTPRTAAYLEHNAIPVQFTNEDLDQVLTGNFVTKVIYLPDAEYAELAIAGVETLVSTRLDPGVDPIVEADRRGSILAVIRVGNKDLGVAGGEADIYNAAMAAGYGGMPCGPNGQAMTLPPNYVAGVTAPDYGMPMSGTPIGLTGPPHIPLGVPAGLQKHVMKNHTHVHLPEPSRKVRIDVKQQPGMSYPKPANHMYIREQSIHATPTYHQPHGIKHQNLPSGDGEYCPPE